MLAVQVQYWTLQETKRHDVATEAETAKHNRVQEDIGYRNLFEVVRHDVAQEDYWNRSLEETGRHNRMMERIDYSNVLVGQQNADTNRMNAQTNAYNAATNRLQVEYNYSLGSQANAISAGNLEQATRRNTMEARQINAKIKQMEAQTDINWFNAATQRGVGVSQAKSAARSSAASVYSAGANVARSQAQLQQQELAQKQFNWNKKMDVWQNVLKTGDLWVKEQQTLNQTASNAMDWLTLQSKNKK